MVGYQQKTFLQIRQSLQRRLRSTETASGTFDLITAINRSVNDALHDVVANRGIFFDWTIREFAFNTTPAEASATPLSNGIFVAAGSSVVTASAPPGPFTLSNVGRILLINGGQTPYEILNFSASNSVGIFAGFEGSTNQVNVPWRMLQDSFTIDARVRKIRTITLEDGTRRWPLNYIPPREWDEFPRNINENFPTWYTVYRYTADGTPRLRVWPIPSTRLVIRFAAYCWLPELVADGDILEVPGPAHRLIEDGAYARLVESVVREDGVGVQTAAARYAAGLEAMIRENMVEPDWDPTRGVPGIYHRRGAVIAYPPEVGLPLGFP